MPRLRLLCLLLLCHLPTSWAARVQVTLSGLDGALEDNVLAYLDIAQTGGADLPPARIRYLHAQAPKQIRKALAPFGFFKVKVEGRLEPRGKDFRAVYRVDPGPPVHLDRVEVKVSGPGASEVRLTGPFPLRKGNILNQAVYERAKDARLSLALALGYLDARYTEHRITVTLRPYRAEIHLHLETGPRYRFGPVHFAQDALDPAFLARYLRFRPGDPFDPDALLTLQSNLIGSGYFSRVEIYPKRDEAQDLRVPIEVVAVPAKPNRYRLGIGYATDTGPRLSGDWLRRRLNRQGHRLDTSLRLSPALSSLEADYRIPLRDPVKDFFGLKLNASRFDTQARTGYGVTLQAEYATALSREGWRRSLRLDYEWERAETAGVEESHLSLIPSINWDYYHADGVIRVRNGAKANLSILGASKYLLSDNHFLQAHAKGKVIRTLPWRDWRVLTRLELGASLADRLEDLPSTERFFAGGDNSIRGYHLDQLGPKDRSGRVVGGRFQAVASLELDRRIRGPWSAALFYDFGNAFDPDYSNEVAQGAGLGVRWQSPVGPVRLDLASALSRDDYPWRLHIVIGPEL